jgi:tetratricopeptide (TPR) repeat protein
VRLLVAGGHLDVLRAEAGKGDGLCAEALADELVRRGDAEAALAVYRPFTRPDRWDGAADRTVAILETHRGVAEAIAFVRPHADAGDRNAVHCLAALLGRHGRADEVIELLRPRLDDWWLTEALVEATAGHGRDQAVTAELEALVAAVERRPDGRRPEPWNAAGLLATVLERQGRPEEAIAVLRRVRRTSVNQIEQLADLLGKAGREPDLRELMAGEGREFAAYRLAQLLEDRTQPTEAAAVLRVYADDGNTNAAVALADLLRRHGRGDEAVEVLLAAVRREEAAHACTRQALFTALIEQGRPEQALGHLDELEREFAPDDVLDDRVWLLEQCGRGQEALDQVRAHPAAGEDRMVRLAAGILRGLGRTDEAIALLRPRAATPLTGAVLAEMLLHRGEVDAAMAVVHGRNPSTPVPDPWEPVPTR